MIPIICLGVFFLLIMLLLTRKRKLKGPLNEKEENQMPLHLRKTEHTTLIAYVYLAGWVINKKASGRKAKIDFVHQYFREHFGKMDIEISGELTKALQFSTNIRSISRWVVKRMTSGKERIRLVNFLIDLSFADGDIIDREYVAIARFADLTGINVLYVEKEINERKKNLYEGDHAHSFSGPVTSTFNRRKAFFSLQLSDNAGKEEIRRAFRKMASRYHPDKFQQASKEDQQAAAEKFLEIKTAYDYLTNY